MQFINSQRNRQSNSGDIEEAVEIALDLRYGNMVRLGDHEISVIEILKLFHDSVKKQKRVFERGKSKGISVRKGSAAVIAKKPVVSEID